MKSIKILAIGNSFSDDCMEYVYDILKSVGVAEVKLGNLYIGGCSLSMHVENAKGDIPAYEYRVNTDGEWKTTPNFKMSDAILSEEWDFIFTQQFSGQSGQTETYGDLEILLAYVKGLAKGTPKYGWQMTWAYAQDTDHPWFAKYDENQGTMYESIVKSVQENVVTNADIYAVIPSGTVIQNMRSSYLGDTLNRDGFHLSYDVGRYATGLATVRALTGLSIEKTVFAPTGVNEKEKQTAIKAVEYAMAQPFQVTSMTEK